MNNILKSYDKIFNSNNKDYFIPDNAKKVKIQYGSNNVSEIYEILLEIEFPKLYEALDKSNFLYYVLKQKKYSTNFIHEMLFSNFDVYKNKISYCLPETKCLDDMYEFYRDYGMSKGMFETFCFEIYDRYFNLLCSCVNPISEHNNAIYYGPKDKNIFICRENKDIPYYLLYKKNNKDDLFNEPYSRYNFIVKTNRILNKNRFLRNKKILIYLKYRILTDELYNICKINLLHLMLYIKDVEFNKLIIEKVIKEEENIAKLNKETCNKYNLKFYFMTEDAASQLKLDDYSILEKIKLYNTLPEYLNIGKDLYKQKITIASMYKYFETKIQEI